MKYWSLLAVLLGVFLLFPVHAADQDLPKDKEDPVHDELRGLMRRLIDAANKSDVDALLDLLDKDVVVTWLNGEVSRGPKQVREYLERMVKGPTAVVKHYDTKPEADDLTHLYGDTGVVFGHSQDTYVLADGREFVMPMRWSGTVVKKDGKWLIASFHASANAFDNPVLSTAVWHIARLGIVATMAGLVLGFCVAWVLRRRRRST
jgi:uncharacterized protein (TIGR02246 family)